MRFGSNEMCKIFSPPKAAAASLNDATDCEGPQTWDIPDRALESKGGSIREGGVNELQFYWYMYCIVSSTL